MAQVDEPPGPSASLADNLGFLLGHAHDHHRALAASRLIEVGLAPKEYGALSSWSPRGRSRSSSSAGAPDRPHDHGGRRRRPGGEGFRSARAQPCRSTRLPLRATAQGRRTHGRATRAMQRAETEFLEPCPSASAASSSRCSAGWHCPDRIRSASVHLPSTSPLPTALPGAPASSCPPRDPAQERQHMTETTTTHGDTPRLLPMAGHTHGTRSAVTCHLRCGDACFFAAPNTTETSYFRDVAATRPEPPRRARRRRAATAVGALAGHAAGCGRPAAANARWTARRAAACRSPRSRRSP